MSPQKRAINYARVSTPRQGELYSLDFQITQERIYDAETNLHIVAEFTEDKSGKTFDKRDQLEEACRMLERDEADILVVWKFDRLHRNYVNSILLRERIRKAGKEIHYAQSRQVSGKTARQRLPEDLQFLMAEIEGEEIGERTEQGKQEKIARGKWLGLNKPPYGYTTVGKGRSSSMVVDESEAEIVRMIFQWYVYGDADTGPLSTVGIAEKLSVMRVPSPMDKLPTRSPKKQRDYGEWTRRTIHNILRHDAYRGIFYQYRYKSVNGRNLVNPDKSTWVGVPVPAIIDESLFDAASRKLDQGRFLSNRGAQSDYLVGRRITCSCGYKMRSGASGVAYRSPDGSIKAYRYYRYRCPGRSRSNNLLHACDMPPVDVAEVDARVWEWVKDEIANPAILERKLKEIQAEQHRGHAGTVERLEILYAHRTQVEDELKKLGKLYTTDMPTHIVEGLISEQSHKLGLTNDEIRNLEHAREIPLTDDTVMELVTFSRVFGERLAAIGEEFEAKRMIIDQLDVQVTVSRENEEIYLALRCILRDDVVLLPLSQSS